MLLSIDGPPQKHTCSARKRPASAASSPRSAPPSRCPACFARASSVASDALTPFKLQACARAAAACCFAFSASRAREPPESRKLRGSQTAPSHLPRCDAAPMVNWQAYLLVESPRCMRSHFVEGMEHVALQARRRRQRRMSHHAWQRWRASGRGWQIGWLRPQRLPAGCGPALR